VLGEARHRVEERPREEEERRSAPREEGEGVEDSQVARRSHHAAILIAFRRGRILEARSREVVKWYGEALLRSFGGSICTAGKEYVKPARKDAQGIGEGAKSALFGLSPRVRFHEPIGPDRAGEVSLWTATGDAPNAAASAPPENQGRNDSSWVPRAVPRHGARRRRPPDFVVGVESRGTAGRISGRGRRQG
jgi:hypothetical protein